MAVFISSMASVLGLGIFLLMYGQLGIAGSAKGSMVAFFAANSGIECALYYDKIEKIVLATSTYGASPANISIDCNGSNVTGSYVPAHDDSPADGRLTGGHFSFIYTVSPDSCAIVSVDKFESGATNIDSFGENISNCAVSSNKAIQRGFNVKY